jgi:hypothetical protein
MTGRRAIASLVANRRHSEVVTLAIHEIGSKLRAQGLLFHQAEPVTDAQSEAHYLVFCQRATMCDWPAQ